MKISETVQQSNDFGMKAIAEVEDSPGWSRALNNATQARKLLRELVQVGRENGYSHEVLAKRLGWSLEAVKNFEAMDATPKLPSITRYAHAVGAWLNFEVTNTESKSDGERNEEG